MAVKGNPANLSTSDTNVDYQMDLRASVISGNIFSLPGAGEDNYIHLNFNALSDTTHNLKQAALLGNVFVNAAASDATDDIRVARSDTSQDRYILGEPLSTTSADMGDRYGLNSWSNITDGAWQGNVNT